MNSLKFTIVTPTVLRPSLEKACQSVHSQHYSNWEHLVIVDDPKVDIDQFLSTHSSLIHQNRKWFKCEKAHHNVGNTCRHIAAQHIAKDTDYVLSLDDDNYYINETFDTLNSAISKLTHRPNWGTFPLSMLGDRFIYEVPELYHVDTNQIFYSPVINGRSVTWPKVDQYTGDAVFVSQLEQICKPVVFMDLPELVQVPIRSYGAPVLSSYNKEPYSLVIPNRLESVINPFIDSLKKFCCKTPHIIIVGDQHDNTYGFDFVRSNQEFVFSHSANLGISKAAPNDVILVNDDVRLIEVGTFNRLFKLAYSDPSIGILSPLIDGACGNAYMYASRVRELWNGYSSNIMYRKGTGYDYISFVCVYLKRQMLDQIGPMDENFRTYGRDDADMCIRAVNAGWNIAVTRDVTVRHGEGGSKIKRGSNYSTTFALIPSHKAEVNYDYFLVKYPDQPRIPTWPQPHAPQPIKVTNSREIRRQRPSRCNFRDRRVRPIFEQIHG